MPLSALCIAAAEALSSVRPNKVASYPSAPHCAALKTVRFSSSPPPSSPRSTCANIERALDRLWLNVSISFSLRGASK
jgi:hypothetical protein